MSQSQFIKNLREAISRIKPRDLTYPGIVLSFLIIVAILFFSVTQFITKNINNAFSGDTGSETSSLNMTNYTLVSKKLGITSTQPQKNSTVVPSTPPTTGIASEVAPQVLDKKSLSINILNSTAKKGVATTLTQALESAGFAKATTGNEKKTYSATTIIIKEGIASFGPDLLAEVSKIYPTAVSTTTPGTAKFDVTIIIGSK